MFRPSEPAPVVERCRIEARQAVLGLNGARQLNASHSTLVRHIAVDLAKASDPVRFFSLAMPAQRFVPHTCCGPQNHAAAILVPTGELP